MIGIGGFGAVHLGAARQMEKENRARLAAVADPRLDALPESESLRRGGVACYDNFTELLDRHPDVSLITLPLPIMLHAPLALECLRRGFHVLVEKPPAPTVAEVASMIAAARDAGRHCGVGFQYSASRFLRAVRDTVASGRLGRVTHVSGLALAQRMDGYYARSPWAGKIMLNGNPVRDGSLNNPCAHTAQLLLACAAGGERPVARPVSLQAEFFAGHDIETEDTCSIRATLDTGAIFHFTTSLCAHPNVLDLHIRGTQGRIAWSLGQPTAQLVTSDGDAVELPPLDGSTTDLFRNFMDVLDGRASRLLCPVEDTLSFAELVEQAFTSTRVVHLHGTPHARREAGATPPETRTFIADIESFARKAFEEGLLFSETGAPWAGGGGRW